MSSSVFISPFADTIKLTNEYYCVYMRVRARTIDEEPSRLSGVSSAGDDDDDVIGPWKSLGIWNSFA